MFDRRLLNWSALFGRSIAFEGHRLPGPLGLLLNEQHYADDAGLLTIGDPFRKTMVRSEHVVVACIDAPLATKERLKMEGFDWVRRYAILPNLDDPRFLVPLESRTLAAKALDVYRPYSTRGQLVKRLLQLGLRYGIVPGHFSSIITIGARETPFIESRLARWLDQQSLCMVFLLGRPLAQAKISIGVMNTANMQWKAFVKAGQGAWVRDVLTNEHRALLRLSRLAIVDSIPQVIDFEVSGESSHLIVSPGPDDEAPRLLGAIHRKWLQEIYESTARPGTIDDSNLALRMREDWPRLKNDVTQEWQARIESSFFRLQECLSGITLPLSDAHGDFAPWNTRLRSNGELFVFDWESWREANLPLHDGFHFAFMTDVTLGKGIPLQGVGRWMEFSAGLVPPIVGKTQIPSLFAAYLVDLALTYLSMLVARSSQENDDVLTLAARLLDDHQEWWLK